ncbi:MAG TPA: molybdenum cofactor guanylyltransferase [Smithella sp.]|nr:molybdenum cofactor guanylyltransferase [Smithella sp.]
MTGNEAKTMKKDFTGIILAGGKNTRMRAPKAFLEVNGKRLIEHTLSIYANIFSEIIIVANDPSAYLEFVEAALVTDIHKNKGPLGGIHAGLFFAQYPHAFIAACDMPFLNEDFIRYLLERSDDYDIVVPRTSDGFQPLHAVYSRRCLPAIEKRLLSDQLKIDDFYKDMRLLKIAEDEIARFDPENKFFKNINTPQDLETFL